MNIPDFSTDAETLEILRYRNAIFRVRLEDATTLWETRYWEAKLWLNESAIEHKLRGGILGQVNYWEYKTMAMLVPKKYTEF